MKFSGVRIFLLNSHKYWYKANTEFKQSNTDQEADDYYE